jgi:hypothetical protein
MLTLAVGFVACGGDSTTSPNAADLTVEQEAAIATAYSTTFLTEVFALTATLESPNQTGKDTTACPGGGDLRSSYTALATGTATNLQNSATADFTYDHCVLQSQSRQYTIDGTLNTHATLATTASFDGVTGWVIKGTLTANGKTCAFDAALAVPTYSGTVCGVPLTSIAGIDLGAVNR